MPASSRSILSMMLTLLVSARYDNSTILVLQGNNHECLSCGWVQIAVYMDFYNCRYGFFTTYNATWVLQKTRTIRVTRDTSTSKKKFLGDKWGTTIICPTYPGISDCDHRYSSKDATFRPPVLLCCLVFLMARWSISLSGCLQSPWWGNYRVRRK